MSTRQLGLAVVVGTVITTGVLGVIAHSLHEPFVFPSVGPTIFLAFYAPLSVQASPRNTLFGHVIGLACGYFALLVFGLTGVAPDVSNVSVARVGAVVLALAATLGLMVWLDVPHAPAGATTMIVSLGFIRTLPHLGIMLLAVVVVIACAALINRVFGALEPHAS